MNPRSGTTIKQIEDAAAEINRHVHQAASLALAGDYRRAHAEAEAAQGAARKLKELLGSAAAQPDITREAMSITCALRPDEDLGKLSLADKRESGT